MGIVPAQGRARLGISQEFAKALPDLPSRGESRA